MANKSYFDSLRNRMLVILFVVDKNLNVVIEDGSSSDEEMYKR